MKPNELRIGNWVNTMHGYGRINEIGMCGGGFTIEHGYHDEDWLEPIPLTPEILERAMGSERYIKAGEIIKGFKDGYLFGFSDNEYGMEEFTELKYLHQLQNLYFALTGEELEVKL